MPGVTDLIYIGGYGRSGSTLLEALLTTSGDTLACGEVVSCLHVRATKPCTCGKSCHHCPVWSPFYKSSGPLRGWSHEIKEMLGGMGINAVESLRGNREHLRAIGMIGSETDVLGIKPAGVGA